MLNYNSIDNSDFYFNGHWLSEFGGIIAGQNGLSPFSLTPQLDIKSEKVLGRDGELVYDATYNPRTFSIPVMFQDLTIIREIAGWLNSKTPSPFYFKGDTVQIDCLIDSALDITAYCYQGVVELKFIAHQPYFYSITDRKNIINKTDTASSTIDNATNTWTQNVTAITNITITNDGNIDSYPIYKLVGVGDLSLTVNGQTFTIKGVTDFVYVDTKFCTAKTDGAVPINFLGSMEGSFVTLLAGNNTITASTNMTSVEIQCRSSWV